MKRTLSLVTAAVAAAPLVLAATPALADSGNAAVGFGRLFHDGNVVRTVVTPTSQPGRGVDAIYPVADGVAGQMPIASVAPGDRGYHGGRWAVHLVDFVDGVTPYLLTSDEDVDAAELAGDVTVTRVPGADFVCPVAGKA
ncbi:MAG: hypothetical protein OEW53_03315 [Actinomycetota bacterium]|nr:hypothetical protein [Actinomycetota bacterium]